MFLGGRARSQWHNRWEAVLLSVAVCATYGANWVEAVTAQPITALASAATTTMTAATATQGEDRHADGAQIGRI